MSQFSILPIKNALMLHHKAERSVQINLDQAQLKNYADKAIGWEHKNAQLWEHAGDGFTYSRYDLSEGDASEYIAYYRGAISQQPAKAQLWAKFSLAKAKAHQFDDEFYAAYARAFKYGGWEYYVNRILMGVGMAHWYSMNIDSRVQLKETVRRLYGANPYQTIALAKKYGQLRMACIWARGVAELVPACEREFDSKIKYHNRS